DRSVAFLMFLAATARARIVASDLRCVPPLLGTRVPKISYHLQTTSDRDSKGGRPVYIRIATKVHTSVEAKPPHGQFWILRGLRTLKCEVAFAQVSRRMILFPLGRIVFKKILLFF